MERSRDRLPAHRTVTTRITPAINVRPGQRPVSSYLLFLQQTIRRGWPSPTSGPHRVTKRSFNPGFFFRYFSVERNRDGKGIRRLFDTYLLD
ncbi:hypothetical protein TNIN_190291 [Trichonephila inaurata madagascariensis]|uniref:Uncharacterized protein n=1 Tax=Trichonephila inaurata madagascariensis TaxID=2747483 RepID=A0A8X6IQ73_9ARAC|nr:hypothetical protein TNIN_158851 [Trichonephila inaurata madagascariensis]GFY69497.1 hypothetical protein TNIN_190291 [Trichonephila inaurata madagascariensis]